MMYKNLSDNAFLNKGVEYCFIVNRIGKKEAVNLLQNVDFTLKSKI